MIDMYSYMLSKLPTCLLAYLAKSHSYAAAARSRAGAQGAGRPFNKGRCGPDLEFNGLGAPGESAQALLF